MVTELTTNENRKKFAVLRGCMTYILLVFAEPLILEPVCFVRTSISLIVDPIVYGL